MGASCCAWCVKAHSALSLAQCLVIGDYAKKVGLVCLSDSMSPSLMIEDEDWVFECNFVLGVLSLHVKNSKTL